MIEYYSSVFSEHLYSFQYTCWYLLEDDYITGTRSSLLPLSCNHVTLWLPSTLTLGSAVWLTLTSKMLANMSFTDIGTQSIVRLVLWVAFWHCCEKDTPWLTCQKRKRTAELSTHSCLGQGHPGSASSTIPVSTWAGLVHTGGTLQTTHRSTS